MNEETINLLNGRIRELEFSIKREKDTYYSIDLEQQDRVVEIYRYKMKLKSFQESIELLQNA